jgi:hypothetical protein
MVLVTTDNPLSEAAVVCTRDRSRLSQELSERLDVATAPSCATQPPVEKPDDQEAIDQSLESRLQALYRMALLSA